MSNKQRGIIITKPFGITEDGGCILGGDVSPRSLRYYLLYWDMIDVPLTPYIVMTKMTEEMEYLKSCGCLTRSTLNIETSATGFRPEHPLLLQSAALIERNKSQPGCWSVAQRGGVLRLPPELSIQKEVVEFELYNSIPIVIPEVPLEEVLAFKEKRKDELLKLRSRMDSIYMEVVSSADIPRSKIMAIKELQDAINDLHKVFDESWKSKLLSTIKVELNLPSLAAGAISGAAIGATTFDIRAGIGAAIGASASALKFNFSYSSVPRNIPEDLLDFAYLHSASCEL